MKNEETLMVEVKKIALFPGTFDPPTLGHLEIIERASFLFDRLYIGVSEGSSKRASAISWAERIKLIGILADRFEGVEVVKMPGLAVDCALEWKANYLVRGLRNVSDFDFEFQMASFNKQMTGVETVLLFSSPHYSHITSTLVREIAPQGRRLHDFVPNEIEETVFQKLSK